MRIVQWSESYFRSVNQSLQRWNCKRSQRQRAVDMELFRAERGHTCKLLGEYELSRNYAFTIIAAGWDAECFIQPAYLRIRRRGVL